MCDRARLGFSTKLLQAYEAAQPSIEEMKGVTDPANYDVHRMLVRAGKDLVNVDREALAVVLLHVDPVKEAKVILSQYRRLFYDRGDALVDAVEQNLDALPFDEDLTKKIVEWRALNGSEVSVEEMTEIVNSFVLTICINHSNAPAMTARVRKQLIGWLCITAPDSSLLQTILKG